MAALTASEFSVVRRYSLGNRVAVVCKFNLGASAAYDGGGWDLSSVPGLIGLKRITSVISDAMCASGNVQRIGKNNSKLRVTTGGTELGDTTATTRTGVITFLGY